MQRQLRTLQIGVFHAKFKEDQTLAKKSFTFDPEPLMTALYENKVRLAAKGIFKQQQGDDSQNSKLHRFIENA